MSSPELLEQLCGWIETCFHQPKTTPNLHCFRVFRSLRLPDGAVISAVSVRHQKPRAPRAPDHVVAELWNLCPGPIQAADVKDMCLTLATFRAWYSEILEEAEVEGLRRRHRFSVHGNLMGINVKSAEAIDLLSHHGGEVAFWTYGVTAGRMNVDPYYGERLTSASVLAPILDHLAWETPTEEVHGMS